ncbi:fibronectin type III domain-containing protein [Bacillus pacificus]|uniref:fibronectin type III domain-containing protein n=2 Tax=Bacillus pacificus TaxID=2026187 RepID=UPI002D78399A|nr:fibronectin type III domain-containing protein [Bacillus pacificus]
MRVKKYFAMFAAMFILCLSVLPSFASADVMEILKDKEGTLSNGQKTRVVTDGDEKTTLRMFEDSGTKAIKFDLGKDYLVKSFLAKYSTGSGYNDGVVRFLDSNNKVLYSEAGGNVQATVKGVRYVEFLNKNGNWALHLSEFQVFVDDGKVSNISGLDAISDINKITLNWENPTEEIFSSVKVYKDDVYVSTVDKPLNSYVIDGLKHNTPYIIKVVSVDDKGEESSGITKTFRTLVDPKTIPPGPVSSFTAEPTDKTVKLKWKKPIDDDLAGFKILQNGKQIAEIGLEEEFTVKNLKPLTDYNFSVVAVDKDKNDSSPVNLSVKTLEEKDDVPPHVPANVFVKPSNGALIASWDKVSDKDLAGYNVYVDDKKINSNLISSTNFTVKNLENSRKYKIQVQAVDRSGNASTLSFAAFGTPDENMIPIIESNYSLQDVSDGVGVMFGQFWSVLAFAVGIPLAFYIIYKLKHTVLP